jgi:flagellar basal body P-ring formation protein FlgA
MTIALAAAAAAAAPFADLDAIERAVAAFAGAVPSVPVDRRLRLTPCSTALELGWYGVRKGSVVVQCPGGWRLFVAVPAQAEALTAPAIARGDAVTIAVGGKGFTVTQPGEALDGGAPGAWIRVRRAGASPSAILRARVVRPGLVALDLP